jgi:phytoene dehydrogenase-like protein
MARQQDANRYDAIVVGGGHNGLIAVAYLAKHGARTVVLEARHKTGGATDTMSPWPEAPDIQVTTLSYVMSLMPPSIGGSIFHGELTVDQLFHMRPAPGYADYRRPITGLYQASSATHAGGGVTGMPGPARARSWRTRRSRS